MCVEGRLDLYYKYTSLYQVPMLPMGPASEPLEYEDQVPAILLPGSEGVCGV